VQYLCANQIEGDTLYIPYSELSDLFDFSLTYKFEMEATWINPKTQQVYSHTRETQIKWYEGLEHPEFEIDCSQETGWTLCEIFGVNFDAEWAIDDGYEVEWRIKPKVDGAYQEG